MPTGYDSFYTDWHGECDGALYYTYVTEELFRVLPTLFPLSTKREDNFVAGLSMGSHGAMKIAVNHPEPVSYTHLDVYKRQVLAIKSLEALQKVADGKATKLIIPSEIQNVTGLLAAAKEVVTDAK